MAVATELKDKDTTVRIATLRSIMGNKCLKILQILSMSEDEKNDTDCVVGAFEKYVTPKTNVVYERYVFGTTNPDTNETVDQYVTRLRPLANSCKFEALLDDFIRDRLVLGTYDNSACARMFREKDLALDAAINICRVSELSQMQLKQIEKSEPEVQFVKTSQCGNAKHQKHADMLETVNTVESQTKEAVISVVLMERYAQSVINFTILLVCVSLG